MGLRERQKAGRRRRILNAADHLFRRRGFAGTSIEEIAERAGVAAGTVYNYFESKGDLAVSLVLLDGEEVRAEGRHIVDDPPRDPIVAVRLLLEGYVDHALVYLDKKLWRHVMATSLTQASTVAGRAYAENDRKLAEQVSDLLRSLKRRGAIGLEVDCDDAGQILFTICNAHFMSFVALDDMPLEEMKRAMLRHVIQTFAGIGPGARGIWTTGSGAADSEDHRSKGAGAKRVESEGF